MIEVKSLSRYYGDFLRWTTSVLRYRTERSLDSSVSTVLAETYVLRILTGFLFPSSGQVSLDDRDVFAEPMESKKRIGYLPEQPPLYPELAIYDYLQFVGRLRGVSEDELAAEIDRVCRITEISEYTYAQIRTLSLGFRKRVGIAQALMGNPQFLIFDEPVSGLESAADR